MFPTTHCPGRCEECGQCRDDCVDCPECADGGCETCLPVPLTPRTAAILRHSLSLLADEVYDQIYRSRGRGGWEAGPLGAVLPCFAGQDEWFLRRYARAFDDLDADLEIGRHPTPTCFPGNSPCCSASCCPVVHAQPSLNKDELIRRHSSREGAALAA